MLIPTNWEDQWISENYPKAVYSIESRTGEIVVSLGYDEEGNDVS